MAATIAVASVGFTAHAALVASGGRARVLAPLSESLYLSAGDEIVWLGRAGAALHGRAVLVAAAGLAGDVATGTVAFDLASAVLWRPPSGPPPSAAALAASGRALRERVDALGVPEGFGALLAGAALRFPLHRAADAARQLARACAADDADGAAAAAMELIGLGPGLTPAGDDYVGGAFFARALLGADAPAWRRARQAVLARARSHTHPISATLLADLCAGAGWAPLHELVAALAAGRTTSAVLDAGRRLVTIGHSSGWDVLAGVLGVLAGLTEVDAPQNR